MSVTRLRSGEVASSRPSATNCLKSFSLKSEVRASAGEWNPSRIAIKERIFFTSSSPISCQWVAL